jgi:hypothetical protein
MVLKGGLGDGRLYLDARCTSSHCKTVYKDINVLSFFKSKISYYKERFLFTLIGVVGLDVFSTSIIDRLCLCTETDGKFVVFE